ncbi:Ribonuclease TUDOR 2 (AtTudor2) (TUDOR-SN protein 2) (100 kDa coactivator-like protein) [Durusdinium trenchii]|uniref:Ribonuclease TUDOR 2 (AtTudor2) (TUDOR-SN protein 2) (100 kDa coactivator-like protein) n=1 Tax=Durusdinium trenchii TaxID=1381693 RepID=A0ABP0IN62_9DINO
MATGFATVKEVLSGDTLVLIGQPRNGPPPEIRMTLASLQAPRLGNNGKGGETKDEPFAWQAREFLREACVGKYVSFKVEYSVPSINRQFGAVCLTTESKENLCVMVARAGWAKVKKEPANENEKSGDLEEMIRVGDEAEQKGLGMFNTDPAAVAKAVRDVQYEPKDPKALLEKVKGKPQKAIVEYARDGGSFKVLLVDEMTYITFNLAGVQCPRLNSGDGAGAAEPFAREAKYFTEMRILNRGLNVVINGIDDRYGMFFGWVEHPAGDIGVELIKNGLARAVDWSMHFADMQRASRMRAAAQDAKNARLRIWKSYEAPKISGDKTFEGVVSEVVSGDTIVVRVGSALDCVESPWLCEERRVSLSSIRAPRMGVKSRDEPPQPCAEEARELLRSRIVGKRCKVSVEYERAPPEGATGLAANPRKFASVLVTLRKGLRNAAVMVVEEGLAEVMRHRADDERSQYYDDLVMAQEKAKDQGKGLHAEVPKEPSGSKPIDLASNKELAKAHLPQLQSKNGRGQLKGIVEYVHNGARLRVLVPAENVVLNLALAGVSAPQTARPARGGRPATEGEPWGQEATVYTKSLVLQREVTVDIETMDKGGTAIGQCILKKGNKSVNVAVELVQQGLAAVNEFSARFTPIGDELLREVAEARQKKLRMWENFDASAQEPANGAKAKEGAKEDGRKLPTMKVTVCEIASGNSFFVQNKSAATDAHIQTVTNAMKAAAAQHGTAAGTGLIEAKRNTSCLALFDDGSGPAWFRAKILSIRTEAGVQNVHIRYIDFGNEQTVKMDMLRPMPDNLLSIPAVAQECSLAFIKVPTLEKDYGQEAAMFLSDLVFGKEVTVQTHDKGENGQLLVTMLLPAAEGSDKEESVAELMLREGLGYVDANQVKYLKSAGDKKVAAGLREAQQHAHTSHLNLWRYGDPREEDEG